MSTKSTNAFIPSPSQKEQKELFRDPPLTLGQRLADQIVSALGSWPFLLIQSFLLMGWILWNSLPVTAPWHVDGFPFILCNLILSFQAAYCAPVVLMSQARQAQKDRLTIERDLTTDLRNGQQLAEITHLLESIQQRVEGIEYDVDKKLQLIYAELHQGFDLVTKQQEQELDQHQLGHILSLQNNTDEIHRLICQLHTLALDAEDRRVNRTKQREARLRRQELLRLAEEAAEIILSTHRDQDTIPLPSFTDDLPS